MTDARLIEQVQSIDWEFSDADTQYLTHNIHRYSGKFIPQIARTAIELLTDKGDTILDSYVGSGTTLLEASLKERNSIGVDLNPLAILISKVKTTVVSKEELNELWTTLIPFVKNLDSYGQQSLFDFPFDQNLYLRKYEENLWRLTDSWNKKWYQEKVLNQLTIIYSAICTITSEKARNIAVVAFSDILRKSSNASGKYPNVMLDKNINEKPLPAQAYAASLSRILDRVAQMSKELKGKAISTEIILGNNLNLSTKNDSVDAIISHPPYIAAIPYAEYGALSLNWLGYDRKALDEKLTGGKRHSAQVVSRFAEDYKKYFIESYRVLKKNHHLFLMVGNPITHGERRDLHKMTKDFAQSAGFTHVTTAIRHGKNRRGNKMGDEYLLFFRK